MQKVITSHLSSKCQVTVPKEARELLGISAPGLVGFAIETGTRTVRLTRVNVTLPEDDFSVEEYNELLKLANQPGGKVAQSGKAAVRMHKKFIEK